MCALAASFALCCGHFCATNSSDDKCQTWLPPEPAHLVALTPSAATQPVQPNALVSIRKSHQKNWSLCLPTVSTALPAARCYSSGCFDKAGCGETRGCKAGLCFHISTSGIKSAGCCNSHPEKNKKHWPACQTSASATTSCLKNGGVETEKTDSRRRM